MKSFRILVSAVLLLCIGFLGYHGYQWWQKHQKRRGLFLYLQKGSPITRRIPEDAVAYVNLYNFKRVHEDLQGTRLYDVFAHWLDTGMSGKQKANSLMGGMLEKSILNVLGEEFGVAILPGRAQTPDFLAVARIAAGSEFLLKLGLNTAKNIGKLDVKGKTVYTITTKTPAYSQIFLSIEDAFAFASNNLDRLQSAGKEGSGPSFLREAAVQAIPEDTFLFVRSRDPHVMALAYGRRHQFHLRAFTDSELKGPLPMLQETGNLVLRIQTNATRLFEQMAASYSLQAIDNNPVAAMLLTFPKVEAAQSFEEDLLQRFAPTEEFSASGIRCHRKTNEEEDRYLCSRGLNVLIAEGAFELSQAQFISKRAAQVTLPFTVKIDFRRERLGEFSRRVETKDWRLFSSAKELYFLGCIRQISGAIDGDNNEIIVDIL